ncbi:hypothetical protein HDV03_005040 [Kappamyces sp. JEL0829]|nr:hypothetical protein HDV03_005040 [Kappamyces sp. JEL0829]
MNDWFDAGMDLIQRTVSHINDNPGLAAAIGGGVVLASYFLVPAKGASQPKPLTTKGDGRVVLGTGGQVSSFPQQSPFVAKLEAVLLASKVPFSSAVVDFSTLPRHKIPILHYDGQVLSDSQMIIEHLINRGVLPDINAWMDPRTLAQSEMFRLGMENFFYYGIVRERWAENWLATKKEYFSDMPWLIYQIIPDVVIRPSVMTTLDKNGTTRYTTPEWDSMMRDVADHASALLGNKPYFFGDKPSVADYSAFGLFANALECSHLNPKLHGAVSRHPNLAAFVGRLKKALYPDSTRI